MPLSDLEGKFTFESFLARLKTHCLNTNEEIRILAYVTDLKPEELFDSMKRFGFIVSDHGDIIEVRANYITMGNIESYSTYYYRYDFKSSLLLCFTSDTLEVASKTMDRFVNQKHRIYQLWIHPLEFSKICQKIIRENENTIINEFHASRFRVDGEKVIREDYPRYFQYNGDDGRYTLEEITKAYGVLPTSIQFIIPNVCKFRITEMGRFTFVYGNIDFLFDIINDILTHVLIAKSIIDKAKIEFIPVNMGIREVRLPKLVPLDIVFSREIDYSEVEQLINNMTGEAFSFEIFDMALIPGSIHLSGTIVDKNKNIAFSITGNSNKVTLSPRKDTSFDSMMEFYKMVTERLDLKAKLEVPQTH